MALFSMRVQVIGRGAGRSAVGAAAYRSGSNLADGVGNRFDYTGKQHVELARIIAPAGAPDWVHDRESLWQQVEAVEKRKDAQLCREVRIMLPREFTAEQRVNVVTDFVQREFAARGMIADVAWHNPPASDGQRNPHVHVMLTMRPITPEGFGKKSAGSRETQQRTTDWNKRELYEGIRKSWEDTANGELATMGSEARIDRRSYAERGIERMPQPYLGVANRVRELKSRMYDRYNQWIAYKASSRAWGYAKKVLDAQAVKLDAKVEKTLGAVDLFERFSSWVDTKTAALSGVPPNLTPAHALASSRPAALSSAPNDKGFDL